MSDAPDKHFLVIKRGALGDVVRTSYFARALKQRHGPGLRLAWLTAPAALPLLRFNPWIDDLWTSFAEASPFPFARVFSLDDERDALEGLAGVETAEITGAYLRADGVPTYTDDAAAWFDMGLLSRFGKMRADALKRANRRSHSQIFSALFGVDGVEPVFFGNPRLERWADAWLRKDRVHIGVNPFAGGRWSSKELRRDELCRLLRLLLDGFESNDIAVQLTLFGAGDDVRRNRSVADEVADARVQVADTDDSVLRLAALIGRLNYLITSDSLAMHLAVAQAVPFLAFFSPTSAVEIDDFGRGRKVVSTAPDYCSYRKDADNSSITAARLLEAFQTHGAEIRLFTRSTAVLG